MIINKNICRIDNEKMYRQLRIERRKSKKAWLSVIFDANSNEVLLVMNKNEWRQLSLLVSLLFKEKKTV